jgi:hypothetical protein
LPKYKKKRARELQHDRFRDTAMRLMDRLGNALEGKGWSILYGIAGLILVGLIAGFWVRWSNRKSDEARRALGRAITIATAPVSTTPATDATSPKFANERDRAVRAIDEFEKVAAKYGDPYRAEARYFIATNQLYVDRTKGISGLIELSRSKNDEVAILSKFALAQAKEGDGNFDEAAQLYKEIAGQNSTIIPPAVANLRLALAFEKQGKKKEAADLLFTIVDTARKSKSADGTPMTPSGAVRDATQELQKLDPDRYAQLPPEAPSGELAF